MRILKQLTRKKNAFFRGIKFNLINYRGDAANLLI